MLRSHSSLDILADAVTVAGSPKQDAELPSAPADSSPGFSAASLNRLIMSKKRKTSPSPDYFDPLTMEAGISMFRRPDDPLSSQRGVANYDRSVQLSPYFQQPWGQQQQQQQQQQ